MKKIIFILLLSLLVSPSVQAKHCGHRYYPHGCYASDIAAGIVGTAAGVMIADQVMNKERRTPKKPRVYIVEPEGKCYTVVSRKTGKITQECQDKASADVIYVD